MNLKMKLNIVNKHEYEENEDYREVIMTIPNEIDNLRKDFEYLGLDYNNLSIQDTHILQCRVIDTKDSAFSNEITTKISNIIDMANARSHTISYQDIKSMFTILKSLDYEERDKLLAVLEIKDEEIHNIKDIINYGNNLECFEFYKNINTYDGYAQKLIDAGDVCLSDIAEYIDNVCLSNITKYINMGEMGEAYVNGNEGIFTKKGLIFERIYKKEEEEEEEDEFE
ncbi:MAG: hypothetical protein HFJ54_09110 [Clostridia bacterium]|nr:hypothetical protein [Clostridia bacterium]